LCRVAGGWAILVADAVSQVALQFFGSNPTIIVWRTGRDNQIGNEGIKALAEALPGARLSSLQTLGLWNNRIGDEGAKALFEALPRAALGSLQQLSLQ